MRKVKNIEQGAEGRKERGRKEKEGEPQRPKLFLVP
jgi:hypothetical protein